MSRGCRVARNAVPTWPPRRRARRACTPAPSAIPPAAMTGTSTASRSAGERDRADERALGRAEERAGGRRPRCPRRRWRRRRPRRAPPLPRRSWRRRGCGCPARRLEDRRVGNPVTKLNTGGRARGAPPLAPRSPAGGRRAAPAAAGRARRRTGAAAPRPSAAVVSSSGRGVGTQRLTANGRAVAPRARGSVRVELVGRVLRAEGAEAATVRHRRRQRHRRQTAAERALHDRMLEAKEVGDPGHAPQPRLSRFPLATDCQWPLGNLRLPWLPRPAASTPRRKLLAH